MLDIVPPEYTSDVGKVRLLIPDTSTEDGTENTNYVFSDAQIQAFVDIANGNIKRAAAHAMVALANDMAMVLKHIRTYDLAVNGPAVAEALRKGAEALREEADKESDAEDIEDAFMIVDFSENQCWPEGAVTPTYGRIMGVGSCR